MGVRSPVYTRTPTMYLDFTLKPRAQVHQNIPESWNGFVYVIEGEGVFGKPNSSSSTAHHVLVLGPGDGLSVWNRSSKPLRFVLIAGQPINEPVVQYGPFVMNTEAEIDQTIEDYHYSKNGFEMAKYWRSQWWVGSANHGSTLLLFKEKEVGINEGHIIFFCLYLSISPFTRSNHTWNLKMMLSFLIGSKKKKSF